MKRMLTASDIHLNFIGKELRLKFIQTINDAKPDVVLITGDISESEKIVNHLDEFRIHCEAPVYFVLGNHCYYGAGVDKLRAEITEFSNESDVVYLTTQTASIDLGYGVGLVGVDAWGDGHYGDPYTRQLVMADWHLIKDLRPFKDNRDILLTKLAELARRDADLARTLLRKALDKFNEVVFMTHVPLWPEAALHKGKLSEPAWAPWFICKAVGDVVLELAKEYPTKTIHVLSGHTHSPSYFRAANNVYARTAGAEYYYPAINRVFTIDNRDLECDNCGTESKTGFGWVNNGAVNFCSEICAADFGYNRDELVYL